MSFYALYIDSASVLAKYEDRESARAAVIKTVQPRPDLAGELGIREIDDESGKAKGPFVSASDLLQELGPGDDIIETLRPAEAKSQD